MYKGSIQEKRKYLDDSPYNSSHTLEGGNGLLLFDKIELAESKKEKKQNKTKIYNVIFKFDL